MHRPGLAGVGATWDVCCEKYKWSEIDGSRFGGTYIGDRIHALASRGVDLYQQSNMVMVRQGGPAHSNDSISGASFNSWDCHCG